MPPMAKKVEFERTKMQAMIDGYESVRPLSDDEKQALPIMLAMAGCYLFG